MNRFMVMLNIRSQLFFGLLSFSIMFLMWGCLSTSPEAETDSPNTKKSSIARLSSLVINGVSVTSNSDSIPLINQMKIRSNVSNIIITPTSAQSAASITINGLPVASGTPSQPIAIQEKEEIITIIVTAEDNVTEQSYAIQIIRMSNNANITQVNFSTGSSVNFNASDSLFVYSISSTDPIGFEPIAENEFANVQVDGLPLKENGFSPTLNVQIGDTVVIKSVSEDRSNTKKYYLVRVGWIAVGIEGFSNQRIYETSLQINTLGELYTAYASSPTDNASLKPTVQQFIGTNWENIGQSEFTNSPISDFSYLLHEDTHYIAFLDRTTPYRVSVMKFDGANWFFLGVPRISYGNASDISLTTDGTSVFVGYSDHDISLDKKILVQKFDGNSWDTVGTPGFSNGIASDIKLQFHNQILYAGYSDNSLGGKPTLKSFNGTQWINVGEEEISEGAATDIQFAISKSGIPFVAYLESNEGNTVSVKQFDGSKWIYVGSRGFSSGSADYLSLALDGEVPYVAYQDLESLSKITVQKFNGSEWEKIGNSFSINGGEHISLAVYSQVPYVLYSDIANNYKATVVEFFNPLYQ